MKLWITALFLLLLNQKENLCAQEHSPTLREIIAKHDINGFDKEGGTDKDNTHCYLDTYAKLLAPFRDKKCSLLEIGILKGGSALLWHDYLPKAEIFLLDIQNIVPSKIWRQLNPSRIHLDLMNAYTDATIAHFRKRNPEGFDVIVEDGNHLLESQKFVVRSYVSLLKKGGILVIEDIQEEEYLEILKREVPEGCRVEIFDLRSIRGTRDDILFVITKQ